MNLDISYQLEFDRVLQPEKALKFLEEAFSPSEDQAEQGADQNEDLVEHGWVGPLDRSVDIILPSNNSIFLHLKPNN